MSPARVRITIRIVRVRWVLLASLVLAAIATSACHDGLRKRASFDLHCPARSLSIVDIGAGGQRVSGCGQVATYVCSGGGEREVCVREGAVETAAAPPTAAAQPSASPTAEAEDATKTIGRLGLHVDVPKSWEFDSDAKGEVYRDGHRHHAVRIVVEVSTKEPTEWIAERYPAAHTWTRTIGNREVLLATRVGKSLRMTLAAIADEGKIYEVACTSDDTTATKTDAICTRILLSVRVGDGAAPAPSASTGGVFW